MAELPTFDDIQQATERITGNVLNTPYFQSHAPSQIAGYDPHFKCRTLTGDYSKNTDHII